MKAIARFSGIGVLLCGIALMVVGIIFIQQGAYTKGVITERLQAEQITLDLPAPGEEGYIEGNVVDTLSEVEAASATIREHRFTSYGTYSQTARGSAARANFLDALTLENSLNLAEAGFGISTMAIGTGVALIVTGLALGGTGVMVFQLSRRVS